MKSDTRPTESRLSLVDAILDVGELRNTAIVAGCAALTASGIITAAHSSDEIGPTEKRRGTTPRPARALIGNLGLDQFRQ